MYNSSRTPSNAHTLSENIVPTFLAVKYTHTLVHLFTHSLTRLLTGQPPTPTILYMQLPATAGLFTFLYFCLITSKYIHILTSSSSENLHELLSPVIILVHVPIAESASMSGTVSTA